MGMNETPSADRVHIGFFGRRNAGKSSIVNKVTGQELAVVSDVKGTTTDPVSKAMELLPMGPVVIIDTPGIDDEGHLGELRVRKAKQVLNRVDVAVLVVDATVGKTSVDEELIHIFKEKEIPYLVVYNKADLLKTKDGNRLSSDNNFQEPFIYASAATGQNIYELKEKIASLAVTDDLKLRLVGDLLEPSDFAVLVVPIDKAAPSTAADNPGCAGGWSSSHCHQRKRAFQYTENPGQEPQNCDHRQPGFCKGQQRNTEGYLAHFVFNSVCQI